MTSIGSAALRSPNDFQIRRGERGRSDAHRMMSRKIDEGALQIRIRTCL
jgi:hypothetical protein